MPRGKPFRYGVSILAVAAVLLFAGTAGPATIPDGTVQKIDVRQATVDEIAAKLKNDAAEKIERDRSLLRRMVDSSVMVSDDEGHGSGFAISKNVIMTAAHVVGDGKTFTIRTNAGEAYKADVLWKAPDRDVALLIVDTSGKADLTPSSVTCRNVDLDEPITLVGNALSSRWRVVRGAVSSLHPADFPEKAGEVALTNVIVNMTINSGDSGGPIYDGNGDIIGMADAVMVQQVEISQEGIYGRTAANIGMMVPASRICPLLGMVVR